MPIVPVMKIILKLNRDCDRGEKKMAASSVAEGEDKGKVTWPNVRSAYEMGDVIGRHIDKINVL